MKEYILQVKYQETMSYFDSHKLPELVRCRDCRKNMMCELTIDKPKDWFCADGKKKEGAEDVR